jgi:hypothetical protein
LDTGEVLHYGYVINGTAAIFSNYGVLPQRVNLPYTFTLEISNPSTKNIIVRAVTLDYGASNYTISQPDSGFWLSGGTILPGGIQDLNLTFTANAPALYQAGITILVDHTFFVFSIQTIYYLDLIQVSQIEYTHGGVTSSLTYSPVVTGGTIYTPVLTAGDTFKIGLINPLSGAAMVANSWLLSASSSAWTQGAAQGGFIPGGLSAYNILNFTTSASGTYTASVTATATGADNAPFIFNISNTIP